MDLQGLAIEIFEFAFHKVKDRSMVLMILTMVTAIPPWYFNWENELFFNFWHKLFFIPMQVMTCILWMMNIVLLEKTANLFNQKQI